MDYWSILALLNLGGLSSPVYVHVETKLKIATGHAGDTNDINSVLAGLALYVGYQVIHHPKKKETRTAIGRALAILGYIPYFFFINLSLSFGKSLAETEAELHRQLFSIFSLVRTSQHFRFFGC